MEDKLSENHLYARPVCHSFSSNDRRRRLLRFSGRKSGNTPTPKLPAKLPASRKTPIRSKHAKTSDGLPTMNYDGETFNILYQDYGFDAELSNQLRFTSRTRMYNRTRAFERFNVTFELINGDVYDIRAEWSKSGQFGDYAYSLVMNHVIQKVPTIINGYYYTWRT